MNRLVAISLVLLSSLLGWILSASPLPMGISLAIAVLFPLAALTPLRRSPLLTICLASLFAMAQWYLFGTGRAFVLLADLPWFFHLGIGLHWACLVESFRLPVRGQNSPLPLFWMGLAGSVLILWTGGAVEIYEANIWMAHSIAGAPLVLSLWSGIFRGRPMRWKRITAGALTILALGKLVELSNDGADKLYLVFKDDTGESSLEDYGDRGPAKAGPGGNDSSARELPQRANISFDGKIRFYLQVDTGPDFHRLIRNPIYVRTSTVSAFESDSIISPVRVGQWAYDTDDGEADALTEIKDPLPGKTINYAVLLNQSDSDQLPLIAETHQVATDAVYEFADDWFQIAPHAGIPWIRLRASAVAPPGPASIEIEESFGRINFASDYMRLPLTNLSAKITQLTEEIVAGRPRSKIPQLVAAYLKENCEYSLAYRNPKDLPPVENFLFDEGKGHCEMYAAAAVMMLRSVAIPARIAYGYSGGSADPRTRMIAFADSDFHAWPEILDAKGKWRIFDTTPVTFGAANRNANRTSLEKIDMNRYEDVGQAELVSKNKESIFSTWFDVILFWLSQNFLLVFSGIGFIAFVYWAVRKRLDRRSGHRFSNDGAEELRGGRLHAATPAFVLAIGELGESYGYQRQASQALGEYVNLLLSQGVGGEILQSGVDYFYRIRYAGSPRDSSQEKQILREVRSLL